MPKSPEERAAIWRAEAMRLAVECDDLHTQAVNLRIEVERLSRIVAGVRTVQPPAPISTVAMTDEPWFDSPFAGQGMTAEQQRRAGLRDG